MTQIFEDLVVGNLVTFHLKATPQYPLVKKVEAKTETTISLGDGLNDKTFEFMDTNYTITGVK